MLIDTMIKKITISLFAFAALCLNAKAQNLNPTVEVTNTYKGKLMEIDKPAFGMAVPDSLLKFDLAFDYSIFDRPYKGAYAFSPYVMDMKPRPDAYKAKNLYLKAGAGYRFRPVLDFVYSHNFKNGLDLNAYAFHESYIGPYKDISGSDRGGHIALRPEQGGSYHNGHDMLTRAGINGGYDWKNLSMSFDLGYYGVHADDSYVRGSMDVFNGKISLRSRKRPGSYFFYDASAGIRNGADKIQGLGEMKTLGFNEFELKGIVGPVINGENKILLDASFFGVLYKSLFASHTSIVSLTPRYEYNKDRLRASFGIKVSLLSRSNMFFEGYPINDNPGQIVYPDVYLGYEAVKERLNLYFKLSGGEWLNTYMSQKAVNPFFNPYFGRRRDGMAENTIERLNASIGAQGNISSHLRFALNAGFAPYAQGRVETVYYSKVEGGLPSGNMAGVGFNNYNLLYANLNAVWDKDPLLIEGAIAYNYTDIYTRKTAGFEPSPLSGRIKLRYNWSRRIYAGFYSDFATSRRGFIKPAEGVIGNNFNASVPGFIDFGLFAEYKLSRKFSLWLEGRNLFDSAIQKNPLYSRGGIGITGGICLNL